MRSQLTEGTVGQAGAAAVPFCSGCCVPHAPALLHPVVVRRTHAFNKSDTPCRAVNTQRNGVVFLLWGKPAQDKAALVDRRRHHVLEAPHPSPLSAHKGFLGCKHFSKANEYLVLAGKSPIDWHLDPTQ